MTFKHSAKNENVNRLKTVKCQTASDEVHRIVPLGLTLREARAWYVNHILLPRVRWALVSVAAGSIILLSMVSKVGESLDDSLATHMIVQHFLLIAAGFLIAYATNSLIEVASQFSNTVSRARDLVTRANLGTNSLSVFMFGGAAALIGFWYLPTQFNAAVVSANVHVEMQITLLFAGGLLFVSSESWNKRVKWVVPVIVGKALGLYGMFLLLTPLDVYAVYPAYEQAYAGAVLLILMLVLDFTVMPLWLYNYFGKTSSPGRGAASN